MKGAATNAIQIAEELTKQMKDAAKILDFERAAYLRDKIKDLRTTKSK